jgi:hypothetical protein
MIIYQCRTCGHTLKSLAWMKKHIKKKGHNPVWEELVPLSKIREMIREELARIQVNAPARAEPIVRITTTQTTVTEMPLNEWQMTMRECHKEIKERSKMPNHGLQPIDFSTMEVR